MNKAMGKPQKQEVDPNTLPVFTDTGYELFAQSLRGIPLQWLPIPSDQIQPEIQFSYFYPYRTDALKIYSRLRRVHGVRVRENDLVLSPAQVFHNVIRENGRGAYSAWSNQLYFSSSDNTDPRSNGREYFIEVPEYVMALESAYFVSESCDEAAPPSVSPLPSVTEISLSGLVTTCRMAWFRLPVSDVALESGFSYRYQYRSDSFRLLASLVKDKGLILREDDLVLGPSQAFHDQIREQGRGTYSIWNEQIYFSTSDNTDPRTNGRSYYLEVPTFLHFIESMPKAGIERFAL